MPDIMAIPQTSDRYHSHRDVPLQMKAEGKSTKLQNYMSPHLNLSANDNAREY